MTIRKQIDLGEPIPAPGEPLQPKEAEENTAARTDDLQDRIERMRAKLTPREYERMTKRHAYLHKRLFDAGYNDLMRERWQVWQEYDAMRAEYATAHGNRKNALKPKALQLKQRGKLLNQMIAGLGKFADEFESLTRKLNAHQRVIDWEREEAENRAAFLNEARTWEHLIKSAFKQYRHLNHSYTDKNNVTRSDIPIIDHIFFREDRVLFRIRISRKVKFLFWDVGWRSALPYDVSPDDLTSDETVRILSAHCDRTVKVVRSKNGHNLFYELSRLDSPDGIPARVLYNRVLPWYPSQDHKKTPWCAGVGADRKTIWFDFESIHHVLIAGSSGGGKSNLMNQMIAMIGALNTPQEVVIIPIDNKGGMEFTHWSRLKHLVRGVCYETADVLPRLQTVTAVMRRRMPKFRGIGAKSLKEYNGMVADDDRLPRILVMVDELATLLHLGQATKDIQAELMLLASQGRAVGVHLIVSTQHATSDVIASWVKTNMGLRIAFPMPHHTASMVILDTVTAAELPNIPGRAAFAVGNIEIIAQSPYIASDEIKQVVEVSQTYLPPDTSEFDDAERALHMNDLEALPIEAPKIAFGRNEVIALALAHFDGKLSRDRMLKLCPDGTTQYGLNTIIKGIIKEGGAEYHGVTYKLKRDRRSYVLTPIDQKIAEQVEEDTSEIDALLDTVDDIEEETAHEEVYA